MLVDVLTVAQGDAGEMSDEGGDAGCRMRDIGWGLQFMSVGILGRRSPSLRLSPLKPTVALFSPHLAFLLH